MPHEIEVKLRVDRRALLRRLERLRARWVASRVHEMNVLFDTANGDLRRRGELIRIRVETPAAARGHRTQPYSRLRSSARQAVTLTYKGPVLEEQSSRATRAGARPASGQYKVRAEEELRASSAAPLVRILRVAGLEPSFCYEKYRQTFRLPGLPGLLVQLDETPIGDFLELEGKPADIDRAAALLGYAPADYIVEGYGRLYQESLRRRRSANGPRRSPESKTKASRTLPGMVFARRKSGSRQSPAANIWNW